MAGLLISPEIRYRDSSGQFLAECDGAAAAAVEAMGEEGVNIARALAPVGDEPDERSVPIVAGIEFYMTGATSGVVVSKARHSLAQERGARAHEIGRPGQMLWNPHSTPPFAARGPVSHPGNQPQPFMRPMYGVIRRKMVEIMARFYPG